MNKKSLDTELADATPKTAKEVFLLRLKRFVGGGSFGAVILWVATNGLTYISDLKADVHEATIEAKQLRLISSRNEEMIRAQWGKIKEKDQVLLELEVRIKVLEHLQATGSSENKYTLVIQHGPEELVEATREPAGGMVQKLEKLFKPAPEDKEKRDRVKLAKEIKKLDEGRQESVEDYSKRAIQEQRVERRYKK